MSLHIPLLLAFLAIAQPITAQLPPSRVSNTVDIRSSGTGVEAFALRQVFSHLSFSSAVHLTHAGDGQDRLFVVERNGVIRVFANGDETDQVANFLDLRDRVRSSPQEAGLFSMAFHPRYAQNGLFYIAYIAGRGEFLSRISEFRVSPDNPDRALPSSERVLIELEQPHESHNGGQVAFGPDGMLYISFGDGQDPNDPFAHGQNPATLFSTILRIDVDRQEPGLAYAIPPDNPFVERDGFRAEIWAWGLRNPWRFSFDRLTGELWLGDVGQSSWEEINLIKRGDNYGWSQMEGFHCFPPGANCDPGEFELPVFEYDHRQGYSITGGFAYRGPRLPTLQGWYVYGDFATRRIWGLRRRADGPPDNKLLAISPSPIASFGEDEAGELYVVGIDGRLYHFAERDPQASPDRIPATISTAGIFADIASQTPAPGLIPYQVNAPLWSDGADKTRLLALPDSARITFATDSLWTFPARTVLVKNFYLGEGAARRIVETRLFVKRLDPQSPEWDGYSYLWNNEGTDARLLRADTTIVYSLADAEGQMRRHAHYYPSRNECAICHTPQAGYVLGFNTAQLNRKVAGENQLETFAHLGLFSDFTGPTSALPRLPDPTDTSLPDALRARAYLDANCSPCHRPGGTGRGELDLRFSTPINQTNLLQQKPLLGDLDITDARVLIPGDPDRSLILQRPAALGKGRMPPLATSIVDTFGIRLLRRWIEDLQETAVTAPAATLPATVLLHPNFPNPFNATTAITFELDRTTPVVLAVYDLSGQRVKVLLNHPLSAGAHRLIWDGTNQQGHPVASGVYLLHLTTPQTARTGKALLLK